MSSSLYDLPFELQERIVSFIDLPKDLLPLALSCQLFYDLIIPNHLDYRIIETHAGSLPLWHSLAINPLLAANVRTLHISGIYRKGMQKQPWTIKRSLVPRSILLSSTAAAISDFSLSQPGINREEALNNIADCLRKLCNLTHFSWELDSRFVDAWTLFPIFATCWPNITGITVYDRRPLGTSDIGISGSISKSYLPLFSFSNLTEISFTLRHPGSALYADELVEMITRRCPELKKLQLSITPMDANIDLTQLIRIGVWSKLKQLSLSGRITIYNADTEEAQISNLMREFLQRNTALESIYFGTERMTPPGFMPIEGLPRLHSLGIGHRFHDPYVPVSAFLSPESVRNLHCFCSSNPITSSCLSLLAEMSSLRYLSTYFTAKEISRIGDVLSRLERLQIGLEEDIYSYSFWNQFVDCMLKLRNLTHLSGPSLFQELLPEQVDQLIQRLGTLPLLRYFKFSLSDSDGWVKFDRDENGAYLGHSVLVYDPTPDESDPFLSLILQ